jgi:hypothetical protein
MIRFTAPSVSIDAAAGDGTPSRTITGIAVPYGVQPQSPTAQRSFLSREACQLKAKSHGFT